MCRATNGAHIEIYWAHKEVYEVQCFENVSASPVHFIVEDIYCFVL